MTLSYGEIQTLLSESAYNPAIAPKLEAYVRAQVSAIASSIVASESPNVEYCFDANRTLIKLYQFFPQLEEEAGKDTITTLVAFLALLQFPSTDFMALSCLIPERIQTQYEPCATLVRCADLLESCNFTQFWPEFRKLGIPEYGARDGEVVVSGDRKLLSNAVNGLNASSLIRGNMIQMLARTYRTASLSLVLTSLDLKDAASLQSFDSKAAGGAIDKIEGDVVTFVATADNTKRVGSAFKEGVSYEEVAALMCQ